MKGITTNSLVWALLENRYLPAWAWLIAALWTTSGWRSFCQAQLLEGESKDVLVAEEARRYALLLCDGYVANREKFQYYVCTCQLRVSRANSLTLEQASRGNLPRDDEYCWNWGQSEAELICARSKNVRLYRFRVPKTEPVLDQSKLPHREPMRQGDRLVTTAGSCFYDYDVIADETYFLQTHPFGTQVGEKSQWPPWEHAVMGPWDREALWEGNLMERFAQWLERIPKRPDLKVVLTVRRNVALEGRVATQIQLELPDGDQPLAHILWIDESRGCMPILKQTVTRRIKERIVGVACYTILDIRKVGGGWWPYHWAYAQGVRNIPASDDFSLDDVVSTPCQLAQEGKVVDLQLRRPPKDLLRVTLHAGDRLSTSYGEAGRRPIYIDQPTEVTVDDIPRLLARYFGQPEPRRPSSRGPIIAAIAAVLSMLLLSWVGYRWYRRR